VQSGKHNCERFPKPIVAGTEEITIGNGGVTDAGTVIELPSKVTAPVKPIALPAKDAPVPKDTEDCATTLPTITADVPMVADEPTAQNTFLAKAPLVSSTVAPVLMVNPDPTWKMKLPFPLRVTVPPTDRSRVLNAVYVPGVNTIPASSDTIVPGAIVEYTVYAVRASSSAWFATWSVMCCTAGGVTTPGGKPVTDVPG
jgi:hypothetical protein